MGKIYHKLLGYINDTQKNVELVNKHNDTPSKKRTKTSNFNSKRVEELVDATELVNIIPERAKQDDKNI